MTDNNNNGPNDDRDSEKRRTNVFPRTRTAMIGRRVFALARGGDKRKALGAYLDSLDYSGQPRARSAPIESPPATYECPHCRQPSKILDSVEIDHKVVGWIYQCPKCHQISEFDRFRRL